MNRTLASSGRFASGESSVRAIRLIGIDEMRHRIKKRTARFWNAVDWDTREIPARHAADARKTRKEIPPEDRRGISKAETYTAENVNNTVRHYLAEFRRKTRCYTKSLVMPNVAPYPLSGDLTH